MVTITIPKNLIKDEGGVVILPLKEYQKLCEMAAPTYYLKGKAAKDLDKLVEGGVKGVPRREMQDIKVFG